MSRIWRRQNLLHLRVSQQGSRKHRTLLVTLIIPDLSWWLKSPDLLHDEFVSLLSGESLIKVLTCLASATSEDKPSDPVATVTVRGKNIELEASLKKCDLPYTLVTASKRLKGNGITFSDGQVLMGRTLVTLVRSPIDK